MDMLISILLVVLLASLSALVGAVTGLLLARRYLQTAARVPAQPPDPFVSAEIDQAAAQWARANGRPEAAGIMADKLHLLHDLGRRRRRS
jgi:hypothetical protein